MAVGDTYYYLDGRPYVETEGGPNITWTCSDCGKPAVASFEYTGRVRCGGCWRKLHNVDETLQRTVKSQ